MIHPSQVSEQMLHPDSKAVNDRARQASLTVPPAPEALLKLLEAA